MFGLGSLDRTWMPLVDFNILSWGYWLHVIGGFFAFISSVALFCNWLERRYEDENDKVDSGSKSGNSDDSEDYSVVGFCIGVCLHYILAPCFWCWDTINNKQKITVY